MITHLARLLEKSSRPTELVEAVRTPVGRKDDLKARGYRWNARDKVWFTEIDCDDLAAERAWFAHQGPAGFFFWRHAMTDDEFHALEAEARRFTERNKVRDTDAFARFIVFDLEFDYDDARHAGYCTAEGKGAESKVRWPFHRIRAASWLRVEIASGNREARFGELVVMTAEEHSECEIVSALFEQMLMVPDAYPVTWGGETKDLAVLRRCACEFDLVLPARLLDLRPHSRDRIDLCLEVSGGSENVHLPEYAAATSIPAKPSPSKSIGNLVKSGAWALVEEQVRADVLTTTIVLLRHLASRLEADIDATASTIELAAAAARSAPRSEWIRRNVAPWARGLQARASLRGNVYRLHC